MDSEDLEPEEFLVSKPIGLAFHGFDFVVGAFQRARGKGGDALQDFWTRLRRSRAKIEAVATDMSPAYIDAVTTHLPGVRLVFDRFHVIKLYNDKLSELRRALYHELKDTMQKEVLKGVRWLLLKRPENLDSTRREPQRLKEALRLNAPLATAYYLKEELTEIWEQEDEEAAENLLMDWITYAESTGIRILHNFAKTLRLHALGILAYYDHPISTGPLEGTNNKIKTMKRQAYGFRDQEFFRLKILGIHHTKYALRAIKIIDALAIEVVDGTWSNRRAAQVPVPLLFYSGRFRGEPSTGRGVRVPDKDPTQPRRWAGRGPRPTVPTGCRGCGICDSSNVDCAS